jgi:hypothetical protein
MREFLRSFLNDWITLVSGVCSVFFWIVSAGAEGTDLHVSTRVGFIIAAAVASFFAAYRVWKKERDAKAESDGELARLRNLKSAIDGIGALMDEGSRNLFHRGINYHGDNLDRDVRQLLLDEDEWVARVIAFLTSHFTVADVADFRHVNVTQELTMKSGGHSPDHCAFKVRMAQRLEKLRSITEQYRRNSR